MSALVSNVRPRPDKVLVDIADYVSKPEIGSAEAYATARLCLMDTLGCGLEALEYPACTKLLGPLGPETAAARRARAPRPPVGLEPGPGPLNIGAAFPRLDFYDTWPASPCWHPVPDCDV